jgi:hypothetical protein
MGIPHIDPLFIQVGRGSGVDPVPECLTPTISFSSLSSPRIGPSPVRGFFMLSR